MINCKNLNRKYKFLKVKLATLAHFNSVFTMKPLVEDANHKFCE